MQFRQGAQLLPPAAFQALAHQEGLQLVSTWLTQIGRSVSLQFSSHSLVTFWAAALRDWGVPGEGSLNAGGGSRHLPSAGGAPPPAAATAGCWRRWGRLAGRGWLPAHDAGRRRGCTRLEGSATR